jgi:hypothetical protein
MANLIPQGKYRAQAIEAGLGETDTGKEQVAVRFKLLDPVEGCPDSITWYGYFTDKTLETTFKALRTAGWKGQDLSDLSELEAPTAPEVILVIEHEADQQNQVRARVRWVNGTGGMALKKALDPAKAAAFASKMRGELAAFDQKAGLQKPAPNAAPKGKAAPTGDDIPF